MSASPESSRDRSQDQVLMARIAQRDPTALSQLYDVYARIIYSVAYRSLGSVEESEEVVLDVFAQVWKTAERYDSQKGRVDAWLFMMARSRVLDRLRKTQRLGKVEDATMQAERSVPKTTHDPIEQVAVKERRQQVFAALAQLPPEQRQVIELAYYNGLSHSEIATATNLSLGTVKTRIRLGLSKLRILLGSWETS
ncbi:MAG: RNA polymerase [Alkalinema sp. CACIAM 70d]|nr:MAG: RNA polymerase [Alkalinema sp. CACIAM 70d]